MPQGRVDVQGSMRDVRRPTQLSNSTRGEERLLSTRIRECPSLGAHDGIEFNAFRVTATQVLCGSRSPPQAPRNTLCIPSPDVIFINEENSNTQVNELATKISHITPSEEESCFLPSRRFLLRCLMVLTSQKTVLICSTAVLLCSCVLTTLAIGISFFLYLANVISFVLCILSSVIFCLCKLQHSHGFFLSIGMGYALVGVDLLLARAANDGYMSGSRDINLYQQFVSSAKVMEMITVFAGIMLSQRTFRGKLFLSLYAIGMFTFNLFMILSITWWNFFPDLLLANQTSSPPRTAFKDALDWIFVASSVLAFLLFIWRRSCVTVELFVHFMMAMILRFIQLVLAASVIDYAGSVSMTGNFFRLLSYAFLFISIGLSSLFQPMSDLEDVIDSRSADLENENMLRSWLVEQMPAIVVLLNHDGQFVHINRFTRKALKLKRGMVPTESINFFQFFHFDGNKEEYINQFRNLSISSSFHSYINVRTKGNEFERDRVIEWTIKTFRPQDVADECEFMMESHSFAQLLCLGRDVTEISEKEKLLEEARADADRLTGMKDAFVSNVSHELRTPLNCIIGLSDLMIRDTEINETCYGMLRMLQTAAHSLLGLIGDLLDFAKLNQGQIQLTAASIDLHEFLECTGLSLSVLYIEKNLDYGYRIYKSCPSHIYCDEHRLRQLLNIILSNAIKFTTKGYITMIAMGDPDDEEKFNIIITDSGVGIPPFTLQEWSTGGETSTDRYDGGLRKPGTGIGLAIGRRLLSLMGGAISIESELGRGTQVRLTLPRTYVNPSSPPMTIVPHTPKIYESDLQSFRGRPHYVVLLLEDSIVTTMIHSTLREDYDLNVKLSSSPEECERLLSEIFNGGGEEISSHLIVDHSLYKGLSNKLPLMAKKSVHSFRLHVVFSEAEKMRQKALRKISRDYNGKDVQVTSLHSPVNISILLRILSKVQASPEMNASSTDLTASAPTSSGSFTQLMTSKPRELWVMVVDDNKTNLKVMQLMLDKIGNVRFVTAENGQEAVDLFLKHIAERFDCIFMDYQMPVKDGPTAARDIRDIEVERGLPRTHIAALTANASSVAERQTCTDSGMDDYMTKPVGFASLTTKLQSLR
ncbi:two-component sensor histidine kinase/response regulator hybrid protein [Planoprotostelium fungivorum]|uniref:Two-component sensor histidine kinase/response regulator hybrid protein n=1 Tax=Planoprotostelium fungivorum TaxID=1890364 RepID=A0A2P6MXZ8_9EUKA|nr:two-component sensor histidine kinase/response regulator hybrid protein [Planoprotostelium fungivorum]